MIKNNEITFTNNLYFKMRILFTHLTPLSV